MDSSDGRSGPLTTETSGRSLQENEKKEIRTILDRLSRILPGFVARPGQRKMIAEVARTFSRSREEGDPPSSGGNIAVIQGPTGTGKTMAYLIAGIVLARSRGKTLIVSTATVSLQEQLFMKDLPVLANVLDPPPVFELAKGRGRYLCERNLLNLTDGQSSGAASWRYPPTRTQLDLLDRLKEDFPLIWDGDRDHAPLPVPDPLWGLINNQSSSCTGKKCSLYSRCPFFLRKDAQSRADIVVANHDLVLSDLVLGGGILLPSPEKSFLVFDEGHHLPSKSLSHFREGIDLEGFLSWVERVPPTLSRMSGFLDAKEQQRSCDEEAESLSESIQSLSVWLSENWNGKSSGRTPETDTGQAGDLFRGNKDSTLWRFPQGKIPEELRLPAAIGSQAAKQLLEKIQSARDRLSDVPAGSDVRRARERDNLFQDLGTLIEKMSDAYRLLGLFGQADPENEAPVARWALEWSDAGIKNHRLEASPVWAGKILESVLWNRVSASCVTSATLMALGTFDSFSSRCGLSDFSKTSFLSLPSPFPLEMQGVLSIPPMRSDPSEAQEHTREMIDLLPDILLPSEGSLVLFSSRRQMETVRLGMPVQWRDKILVQGEKPRREILELHERRVLAGEGSVIFGLSSFSEGLDLRGNLCTHVVIAKIPFPVPTEPVEETLAEWIRSRGGDPFREISLPEAGLRLVQAAGRLIRSETDRGKLTILDKRLTEKRYGPGLLRSLPPFRRENPEPDRIRGIEIS